MALNKPRPAKRLHKDQKDWSGVRMGKVLVVEYIGGSQWRVICDCGNYHTCWTSMLSRGVVRSCGCIRKQKKHGQGGRGSRRSPEYRAWIQMRVRCDPDSCYVKKQHYADRGITVCDRWKNSFQAFYEDVGPRPSPKHSLDRINNDGNYEPGNCRWATQSEQHRNRRNTLLIEFEGVTLSLGEWATRLGACRETLRNRYHRGWPANEVLFGKAA